MDKVVFITGASRGIGATVVEKFVKEGWNVAGFYNENKLQDTENINYFKMDISSSESIRDGLESAYKKFGKVDCLVNCAGVFGYKKLQDYDEKLMDLLINTNERGMYLLTKYILKYLHEGSMVFVSSTAAQIGSSDPIYGGTKAAVLGFVKSMAKALAPKIRVNCVAPGPTNTHMMARHDPERIKKLVDSTPLGRMAEPGDIAETIYFLASDSARHITGATFDVNGGMVLR